jgi:hypothetical protein
LQSIFKNMLKFTFLILLLCYISSKNVLRQYTCSTTEPKPDIYIDFDRCYDTYVNPHIYWIWKEKNSTHVVKEWNCDKTCLRCSYVNYQRLNTECSRGASQVVSSKPLIGTDGFYANVAEVKPSCRTDSEYWVYDRFFNKSTCFIDGRMSHKLYWRQELNQIESLTFRNDNCGGDVSYKHYFNLNVCSEIARSSDKTLKARR